MTKTRDTKKSPIFSLLRLAIFRNPWKSTFLPLFDKNRHFFQKWRFFVIFVANRDVRGWQKVVILPPFLAILALFSGPGKNRSFLKKRVPPSLNGVRKWVDFWSKSGSTCNFTTFWPLFGPFFGHFRGSIWCRIPDFFQFFPELKRKWPDLDLKHLFYPKNDPFLTPFWPLFWQYLSKTWIWTCRFP